MSENDLKDDLSNYNEHTYEKASHTADVAICTIKEDKLSVLLVKRKYPPFRDCWALPGGFLNVPKKESLEKTAERELVEETGLTGLFLEQLKTYSEPDRDPRTRVITTVFYALLPFEYLSREREIQAGDDAKEVEWFPLRDLPENLAFDHKQITKDLLNRLSEKIWESEKAFRLLPEKFTWSDLRKVYEIILGKELFDANFRRKIKERFNIKELDIKMKRVTGRPPTLIQMMGMAS